MEPNDAEPPSRTPEPGDPYLATYARLDAEEPSPPPDDDTRARHRVVRLVVGALVWCAVLAIAGRNQTVPAFEDDDRFATSGPPATIGMTPVPDDRIGMTVVPPAELALAAAPVVCPGAVRPASSTTHGPARGSQVARVAHGRRVTRRPRTMPASFPDRPAPIGEQWSQWARQTPLRATIDTAVEHLRGIFDR